ncbi:hypothetical protein F4809DRAFT_175459 [Biscogniauxia mediterranea]|nr:hypothetical protein F4809DRAFT_175459 [Biscogniauxia mediterranea]
MSYPALTLTRATYSIVFFCVSLPLGCGGRPPPFLPPSLLKFHNVPLRLRPRPRNWPRPPSLMFELSWDLSDHVALRRVPDRHSNPIVDSASPLPSSSSSYPVDPD